MGRAPCSEKEEGLKKGAWTAEEDEKLVSFIQRNKGHGSWRTLPKLAGLERCGKSCRLRWTNYLRPNIKRGNFSAEEERVIIQLHAFMGNKWSSIASHLPGRTDNEVKNHWNTHLKKRLTKMGIDPMTHLPLQFIIPHNQDSTNYFNLLSNHYQSSFHNIDDWKIALLQRSLQLDPTAITCHLAQWELARLEAEARMQITASSHDHIQNYASWLQHFQQSQAPGYNLNDFVQALNMQLQASLTTPNSSMENASTPLQPSQYCVAQDDQVLKHPNSWENQENQCLDGITIYNKCSSNSTCVPHASEGPIYTSTCSIATPETCTSSDSTSQLLCDQLQLPVDLLLSNGLNSPTLDDGNLLHESYWNKMFNLLEPPVTLEV